MQIDSTPSRAIDALPKGFIERASLPVLRRGRVLITED